jgi:hypothetical protein
MEPKEKEYRLRIKEIERQLLIVCVEPFLNTSIEARKKMLGDPSTPQWAKEMLPSERTIEILSNLLQRLKRVSRGRPRKVRVE